VTSVKRIAVFQTECFDDTDAGVITGVECTVDLLETLPQGLKPLLFLFASRHD